MAIVIRGRKKEAPKPPRARKSKVPSSSLHSQGVAVSVDERIEVLVRRYPALRSSLGTLLFDGKKKIRDIPPSDQARVLRMVLALKKSQRA